MTMMIANTDQLEGSGLRRPGDLQVSIQAPQTKTIRIQLAFCLTAEIEEMQPQSCRPCKSGTECNQKNRVGKMQNSQARQN